MHPQTRLSEDTPPPRQHILTIAECTVVYMIILLFEDQGSSPWNPGSSTVSGFQTFSKDSLDFFFNHISSVELLSRVQLFVIPWTKPHTCS